MTEGDRQYRKGFYRLGETADMVGVEGHVLRFWETEFPMLQPHKSPGGQRRYRPEDIELLHRIRSLLYEEGYTIAGARRQLSREADGQPAGDAARGGDGDAGAALTLARQEIRAILTLLGGGDKL